jgi:integrase
MPNYKGRRPGTRRVVVWKDGAPVERIFEGSKADGDRFEAALRIELEAHEHDTRSVPSFGALCREKYTPFAKANFASSTWRTRKHLLVNLCEFFDSKKLTDFTSADTEAYKAFRKKSSDLSPSSTNGELRFLLNVLRWAEKQGYAVRVPWVTFLKAPAGRARLWSRKELNALLTATKHLHPELLGLVLFLLNTGCRKGEALACEWSWVDLKAGMLRIPANRYWKPKSGRAREVPLSDACREVLDVPEKYRRSERWVFPNRDGVGYSFFPDAIFKELEDEAEIAGGAHTLRHCFASMFLETTPDLYLLAQILGHSHTRTTELYAHLLPDHLGRARNAVNVRAPRTMAKGMASATRSRKTA